MNSLILTNFKRHFKFSLGIFCGLLLFISCDDINSSTEKEPPVEQEITVQQMQNKNNPFDQQGVVHNEFLDYFGNQAAEDTAISERQLLSLLSQFYEKKGREFGDERNQFYLRFFDALQEMNIGGPVSEFPNLATSICEQYPDICDVLNAKEEYQPYQVQIQLLNEDNEGSATEKVLKFIATTIEQETMLMRDKNIEDGVKNAILSQLSVARFSASYWHNMLYIQKDKNPLYKGWIDADSKLEYRQYGDVVRADAVGALVGSVGGPVSSLGGAAIASAASYFDIFPW